MESDVTSPQVRQAKGSGSSGVPPIRLTPREKFSASELPVTILTVGGPRGGSRSGSEYYHGMVTRFAACILASRAAASRALHCLFHNRWVLGCLFSFVFIWMVSALFGDGSEPYSYDAATQSWVITPGTTIVWKSEGWGRSYFGRFGIGCIPDVSRETRGLVLLWGDSDVEAFPVDDHRKMAQQLTGLLTERGRNLVCASRAMGGDNLADYILNIPAYEEQLPAITRHIILMNGPDDVLPDQANDTRGIFRTTHGYELLRRPAQYHSHDAKRLIDDLRLYFAVPLLRSLTRDLSLRFTPGPVPAVSDAAQPDPNSCRTGSDLRQAWDFLAARIRQATRKGVAIVYVPHVPRIEGNRVVCDDPDWPLVSGFAASCRDAGIDFINLHETFVRHYTATGEFPRGFPNSRPGDGHLNVTGHRLIAEALFDYLEKTRP
jgi:hypothetical protein